MKNRKPKEKVKCCPVVILPIREWLAGERWIARPAVLLNFHTRKDSEILN